MINVLNVVIENWIGGIQNRILMTAPELAKRGVNTIVLAPKGDGNFSEIARNNGFNVYQSFIDSPKFFTSPSNLKKNIFWFIRMPLSIIHISRIIKKEKIDIVHVNGLLALQPAIAAKITDTPLVWHLVSSLYPKRLVLFLRHFIKKSSNKIVFITKLNINYYLGKKYPKEKIKIIYEPVDTAYFDSNKISDNKKNDVKKRLGITDDCKIIGFVGNICPVKNLETLLKIAHYIKKNSDLKLKVLIVGSIDDQYYYEKLVSMRKKLNVDVDFLGPIFPNKWNKNNEKSEYELREIYSIMDVFLLTSIAEGTPLVISEAMAMEKPVVSTDVGGISEQIVNNNTGIILPVKDTKSFAEAIISLFNNDEKRILMGKKGKKRVEEKFTIESFVNNNSLLYKKI